MLTNARLPVLWLCGAPATGKSTVARRVFSDLGAQVLVVSGVIDPEQGHDFAEMAVEADITFCHLTVDEPTLRERLAARGWPSEAADEAVVMMSALSDSPFVTTVIDTTGRDPQSLARDAAALVTPAASTPGAQELSECTVGLEGSAGPESPVGAVTIVIGPRAVGKSSVSWGMAMRRWVSGERTVYVDLDQVGFLRPAPSDSSLQAANLAVIWRNALSRGAHRLIVNGMVTTNEDLAILRHAVRPAPVQALRLAASPDALWDRIRARSAGSPSRLINDDLENAALEVQSRVHRVAVGQNAEYAASDLGDDVIDTTNLGLEEAVEQAL